MKIRVNGMVREVPSGINVEGLITLFQLKKQSVVLELNRKVLDRGSFLGTQLKDDDSIEIVHFVGGG